MATELIFFILTGIVVALLLLAGVVALVRGRGRGAEPSVDLAMGTEREVPAKYLSADGDLATEEAAAAGGGEPAGVLRIVWWLTIAVVLVGVGVSSAYRDNQPLIFGIGALAVVSVVFLHELLPAGWGGATTRTVEALVAIALASGILMLTGYGGSPFFFALDVIAVAVALSRGGAVAAAVAGLATLAYLGVLGLDPNRPAFSAGDLLRFGLNIGSIWLLAYLAGVFAVRQRRVRHLLFNLSRTDPLTGLLNRAQIFATLEQEVRRTRRSERGFCLLMLDLDGLKAVNDVLGHQRGDQVLRALSAIVRRSIRGVDTAYRYGGDEFLVLLPETDYAGAFVVAEKIRAGAEEVGEAFAGEEARTSVSIGLVSHPEDGASAEELMLAADKAMYHAKSLGKNQISGYPRPRRFVTPLPRPAAPTGAPPQPPEELAEPADVVSAAAVQPPGEELAEPAEAPAAAAVGVEEPPTQPIPVASDASTRNGRPDVATDESEPDPAEVRRQIEAASRRFDDSDYRIRRAMDAFLSSPTPAQPPPAQPPNPGEKPPS